MGRHECVSGISFLRTRSMRIKITNLWLIEIDYLRLLLCNLMGSPVVLRGKQVPQKTIRRINLERHFQTNVEALGSGIKVQVRLKTC